MDHPSDITENTSLRQSKETSPKKSELPFPNTTKTPRKNERFKIVIYGCSCCLFTFLGLIIYYSYLWNVSVFEERKEIDQKITVVSEKWLNYETNKQINCTNDHTCLFNCSYIEEHFHKNPSECEYTDYYNVISIIVEVWLAVCICSCIFGKK